MSFSPAEGANNTATNLLAVFEWPLGAGKERKREGREGKRKGTRENNPINIWLWLCSSVPPSRKQLSNEL